MTAIVCDVCGRPTAETDPEDLAIESFQHAASAVQEFAGFYVQGASLIDHVVSEEGQATVENFLAGINGQLEILANAAEQILVTLDEAEEE